MSEKTKEILDEIKDERGFQDEKWGEQNHKPIEWIAILTEEVGEAAKEAVDHHFNNPVNGGYLGKVAPNPETQSNRLKNYRKELIQVAAVAVSMIESLDRNEL